jgi:hypothetical protein
MYTLIGSFKFRRRAPTRRRFFLESAQPEMILLVRNSRVRRDRSRLRHDEALRHDQTLTNNGAERFLVCLAMPQSVLMHGRHQAGGDSRSRMGGGHWFPSMSCTATREKKASRFKQARVGGIYDDLVGRCATGAVRRGKCIPRTNRERQ